MTVTFSTTFKGRKETPWVFFSLSYEENSPPEDSNRLPPRPSWSELGHGSCAGALFPGAYCCSIPRKKNQGSRRKGEVRNSWWVGDQQWVTTSVWGWGVGKLKAKVLWREEMQGLKADLWTGGESAESVACRQARGLGRDHPAGLSTIVGYLFIYFWFCVRLEAGPVSVMRWSNLTSEEIHVAAMQRVD